MRVLIIGLGVQGRKRRQVAGAAVVGTVDPVAPGADFRHLQDVPLPDYDAACVCVPDREKLPLLRYLLSHRKHLLVEKPLPGSDAELQELQRLSRENRTVCYTAYNHRFEPHIARLKETLDTGALGPLYLARLFYGNGTARDVRNSPWRDQGAGVIPDLGSHLLDTVLFLLGRPSGNAVLWNVNRFENQAPDHVLFGFRGRPTIELEATLLSWRNTFTLDLYGEQGSAHIHCLCKWGPSTLTLRQRVLPSGRPKEEVQTIECSDPTWQIEYGHFLSLCQTGGDNLDSDFWISSQVRHLDQQLGGVP